MRLKLLFFAPLIALLCACSEERLDDANREYAHQLYEELNNIPSVPILPIVEHQSRSLEILVKGYPTFTDKDLQLIASLSIEEREALIDKIFADNGWTRDEGEEILEKNCEKNYKSISAIVGENHGISQLKDFATSYILAEPGWKIIEELLPEDLNREQYEIYIGIAAFVDKTIRPIESYMVDNTIIAGGSADECLRLALERLGLAGIEVGANVLLGLLTDGAGLLLDTIDSINTVVTCITIWNEYKLCMGMHGYIVKG